MATNSTLKYRVTKLEKKVDELCDDLNRLTTNHIPHLQTEIEGVKGDIKALKTRVDLLTMINLGALVLSLVFAKLL